MIVTWIGYLGGVAKAVFDNPIAAGLAGAAVATFFTLRNSALAQPEIFVRIRLGLNYMTQKMFSRGAFCTICPRN